MAKKTGLGRGLDALFSDTIKEPEIEEVTGEIVQNIKITKIEPDKEQPRKRFDEEKLDELANSIKQYGVIQPIIVTLKDDYYQIIAGERRWRAAKKAGLTEIPCLVTKYAVRKSYADGDQKITFTDSEIGCFCSMHSKHSGIKIILSVKSSFSHEGITDRRIYHFDKSL